jgi:hypothetical protein
LELSLPEVLHGETGAQAKEALTGLLHYDAGAWAPVDVGSVCASCRRRECDGILKGLVLMFLVDPVARALLTCPCNKIQKRPSLLVNSVSGSRALDELGLDLRTDGHGTVSFFERQMSTLRPSCRDQPS